LSQLARFKAPDAEAAIKKAIEQFEIKDPQKQRRLIAQLHRSARKRDSSGSL